MTMWIAESIADFRAHRRELAGTVGLVPTMGALHAGHLSLVRAAAEQCDHVVASLFVNPTQFGAGEDFTRYPRPEASDLAAFADAGVAGVFKPTVDAMYPPATPACEVLVPALAGELEGRHRPTHFAGVCRVVAKLLNVVQADVACFGRKDYQQWRIIEAMAADLCIPTRIVGCPTVREPDGLAMSSRNQYLDDAQRQRALGLSKALREAKVLIEQAGETDPKAVERAMEQVMIAHRVAVDYAAVRHPTTLGQLDCVEPSLTGGVVALVAGRVDEVRLIDNDWIGVAS
jgi:pantoate--beta-alanine ligase